MSSTAATTVSSLERLVIRLEQDIRQRGLWAGDKYLTSSEAAEMLGVSPTTADRAMQLLSKRQMLVRRRNLGTFVGPHFEPAQRTMIRTVYLLVPPAALDNDSPLLQSFIYGIRSEVQDVNVQVSFLPRDDIRSYTQGLIQSAISAGKVAGFVPISCPGEVYRRLADSGIPTVMFGTPYINQMDVPSVDVDNRAAGRLLIEHLIGRNHRRIVLFTAMEGRPGDNYFYDGMSEALTASWLPHNSLIIRIAPKDPESIATELGHLMAMPDRPTAIVARSRGMAKAVAAAIERLAPPAAQQCELVAYQNDPAVGPDAMPFAHVQPKLSLNDIAAQIGRMLEQLGRGEPLDQTHVVLPVELCPQTAT